MNPVTIFFFPKNAPAFSREWPSRESVIEEAILDEACYRYLIAELGGLDADCDDAFDFQDAVEAITRDYPRYLVRERAQVQSQRRRARSVRPTMPPVAASPSENELAGA
ncbi:MAG: hypothetical protein HOM34_01870 [Planctomycetes bacterium]|jgi:hypothetical protein|nr:hypothetical protein [Planctomycetota bacterium]MBT4028961.1 hypothetical protein [Planctomycetota bacterium]MBT4560380.1 hypothetical protein [Planctomycetota bacterium]MBT5101709.1 hypothetical protein [Planctomycetota bacterium]MBT5119450.1 hypothetical protein [Planctomycetota bacterium]